MARKSTKQVIEENTRGYDKLKKELKEFLAIRDNESRELNNAKRRLARKRKSDYPNKLFNRIVAQLKKEETLPQMLMSSIDRATETNDEFAKSAYKSQLYKVAANKDIYKLFKVGEGWNSALNPQIVFEEEAGTLSDWAKGIELYREQLGVETRDGRSRAGFKATVWWIENVFGTSLETRTIYGRIQSSGRVAPFWQILNNGSQPLTSDRRDGSFNPLPASPTDFIGDAEFQIRTFFLGLFLPEKIRWTEETQALEGEIAEHEAWRDRATSAIDRLTTDLRINELVYSSFGELKRYVDKNKLADAIQKYRAGEEFEKPTIELTKSGGGKRIRTNIVRKLEGLIQDE